MAAVGNNVYVAWLNNTAGNSDVVFRASHNNGTSFDNVIKLSNTPNGDSSNQQVTAVGSNVYMVWQANVSLTSSDVFFRASTNNGTSFGSVIDLSSGVSGLTNSAEPQAAAVGNNVTVVWLATSGHNPVYNILAKTSTTNGSNLGTVTPLNLSKTAYLYTYPRIAESGKYVYVTWSDTANTRPQIFFSFSSNSGSGFSAAISLDSNSVTGQTDLNQVMAAAGKNLYVAWTNDTMAPSDNTMFRAVANNGASLGPLFNMDKGVVTELSPQVAASGSSVYVIWTNGTRLLYQSSNNNGTSFGNVVNLGTVNSASCLASCFYHQAIAAQRTNVYVIWTNGVLSSHVYFISSSDNGVTFGTVQDLSSYAGNSLLDSPVVAGSGTNVYVTWQDDALGNGDILFRGTGAPPDVAVSAIVLSRIFAYSGVPANPIIVNVTASNPGTGTETFFVTVKANGTLFGNQTVTGLAPGASKVVTFNWNTAPLARGNYTLTAQASPVTGETNLSNNNLTWGGTFTARFKGDVNYDCTVNIKDLSLVGIAFTSSMGPPASPNWNPYADLNNDRTVNIVDLVSVAVNFNQSC